MTGHVYQAARRRLSNPVSFLSRDPAPASSRQRWAGCVLLIVGLVVVGVQW